MYVVNYIYIYKLITHVLFSVLEVYCIHIYNKYVNAYNYLIKLSLNFVVS